MIAQRVACLVFTLLATLQATLSADDVIPRPQAHAHNDYYHTRPLLDALSHGFCSVEADVFLVDDNPANIGHVRDFLTAKGHTVTVAHSGEEALQLAQALPDIVFMDISMPEMDGKEAARTIRRIEAESGGHVPIVAMTAHAMAGDEEEILACGLDRYMTKPLKKDTVLGYLDEFCPDTCLPPLGEDLKSAV